ncbi:MAG: 6-carboxytetrahydropterin synthase [Lentisphaeria bacterium]|nr:6-carboxytetrahydropterin synthase [Lentisphaeria bacterium]
MFDIEIRRTFSAAHQLKGYDGDCRNLHGHNYNVIAVVRTDKLNEIGIALDFKRLKAALDSILDGYDHKNLSELPEYAQVNPTSEVMSMKIYRRLSEIINDENIKVRSIRIEESASSGCTYFEE